jgi:hypothetical protein
MLFIDVVRDPRAQVCSMNKAIIYDFDTMLNTLRWVESREWVDKLKCKYSDKVLTIKYEDFVEKHEHTMKTICNFLSIPFQKEILDISLSSEAHKMSIMSPLWETNDSFPNPVHINKYIKSLTMNEIESIETITMKWMKEFNYTPVTKHQMSFAYDLKQARINSDENKQKVWDNLKDDHIYDYILRKSRFNFINSLSVNM